MQCEIKRIGIEKRMNLGFIKSLFNMFVGNSVDTGQMICTSELFISLGFVGCLIYSGCITEGSQ
jgi:hypothetical protein